MEMIEGVGFEAEARAERLNGEIEDRVRIEGDVLKGERVQRQSIEKHGVEAKGAERVQLKGLKGVGLDVNVRDELEVKGENLLRWDRERGERVGVEDDRVGAREKKVNRRVRVVGVEDAIVEDDLCDGRDVDDQTREGAHANAGECMPMEGAPVEELDDQPEGRVRLEFEPVEHVLGDVQPGVGRGEGERESTVGLADEQRLKCVRVKVKFELPVENHVRVARAEIEIGEGSSGYGCELGENDVAVG